LLSGVEESGHHRANRAIQHFRNLFVGHVLKIFQNEQTHIKIEDLQNKTGGDVDIKAKLIEHIDAETQHNPLGFLDG
jgi:hypothetical protein